MYMYMHMYMYMYNVGRIYCWGRVLGYRLLCIRTRRPCPILSVAVGLVKALPAKLMYMYIIYNVIMYM